MATSKQPTLSRRTAVSGGAAALLGAGMIASGVKTASAAPSIQSGGGLAGGGTIALDTGKIATFSIFASRFAIDGQDDPLFFARVVWRDETGFTFTSKSVESYGPIEGDDENARAVKGTAALADDAEQPFQIRMVDTGQDSEEPDTLELTIGPSDNIVYSAKGTLASGDLTLLTFDFIK